MEALRIILSICVSYTTLLILFGLIYCWGMERRRYFPARLLVVPVYILLSTYNPVTVRLQITLVISWLYGAIPYINTFYILNAALCVLILKFLFKASFADLLFISVIAYVSEHISSHINQFAAWIIHGQNQATTLSMSIELLFAVTVAAVIRVLLRKYFDQGIIPRRRLQITFILMAVIASMGISSYVYSLELFSVETNLYEILISILLFFLLFSIFRYSNKEHTEVIVKHLLDEQLKQTNRFNENYQFINMKFHDLKKQVRGLEESIGRTAELTNIAGAIAVHETNIDTGNPSLDIVIREYAIICMRREIQYYCLAEGSALSFLTEEEIYGLFHNALSNAVEAAVQCPPEERYISVSVQKKDHFVRIRFENSFCGPLDFQGDVPVTTKKDQAGHGFGMKSIRYIIKEYNGNMTITAEDGCYRLNILFMR